MSDAVIAQSLDHDTDTLWFIQEKVDREVVEGELSRKRTVADAREARRFLSHTFGHRRRNGQRRGFGDGERHNAKRCRWAKNRQMAVRAANRVEFFDPFNPKEDNERARRIRATVIVDL